MLVVDDEVDARAVISAALQQYGALVRLAASAGEALDALEALPPDVLVSDIGMPGEDGYSLIRRVRALPPYRGSGVPAVALTGYASEEDRERAAAAGYHAHVPKPVDTDRLVEVVARLAEVSLSAAPSPAPAD